MEAHPPLTWTDWPARRAPGRTLFAILVIGLSVAVASRADFWLGLAAALGLLGATAPALLPLRYRLSEDAVALTGPLTRRQVAWRDVAGWVRAPEGFLLVGRGRHRFLRRRRQVWLRCPSRESVVESWLSSFLGAPLERP